MTAVTKGGSENFQEPVKQAETLNQAVGNGIDAMNRYIDICPTITKHVKHFLAQQFTVAMNDNLPKEQCLQGLYERITR